MRAYSVRIRIECQTTILVVFLSLHVGRSLGLTATIRFPPPALGFVGPDGPGRPHPMMNDKLVPKLLTGTVSLHT